MLHAYGKNIVCKAIFEDKKGKLILTNEEQKPLYYQVISMGEEVCDLEIGDKIIVKEYFPFEIKHKDENFLIIDKDYILAIIEL